MPIGMELILATRNVALTDRQDELIDTLVEAGRYQNASEVLREGLRLIEQREAEDAATLAACKDAAKIGVAAVEARDAKTFADVASYRRHHGARRAKRSAQIYARYMSLNRGGRYFMLYRETRDVVTVLRIRHDSMDLSQHVPKDGS